MSGFGIPRLFGKNNATPPDDPPTVRVSLLLETEGARDALLRWAEANLPEGECLIECKELAGRRRAYVTKPEHADAEPVARTVPRLIRGRLLSASTFYRVPVDKVDAVELHYEEARYSHSYETRLKPLVRGRAARDLPMIPA